MHSGAVESGIIGIFVFVGIMFLSLMIIAVDLVVVKKRVDWISSIYMRCPRIQGLPKQTSGRILIRERNCGVIRLFYQMGKVFSTVTAQVFII